MKLKIFILIIYHYKNFDALQNIQNKYHIIKFFSS